MARRGKERSSSRAATSVEAGDTMIHSPVPHPTSGSAQWVVSRSASAKSSKANWLRWDCYCGSYTGFLLVNFKMHFAYRHDIN